MNNINFDSLNPVYPFGVYNNSISCWGLNYLQSHCMQPYSYDELCVNNNWIRPYCIVEKYCVSKDKSYSPRELYKRNGVYFVKERDGREVKIGKISMQDKHVVGQQEEGTFDAFFCTIECDGLDGKRAISIPYKPFIHRDILQYIPFFKRNADCPDKYIVMAFYAELLEGDDIKYLQLPQKSGWQEERDGYTSFASAEIVIPQLASYYPDDILERHIAPTSKSLAEAADSLAKVLPPDYKYKFLVCVDIAADLQYFFNKQGLQLDRVVVVEPKSEANARAVTMMFDCQNNGMGSCSLTDNKTTILKKLNSVNDGAVIIRDASYIEENKKRDAGLDVILQDLHGCTGNKTRHFPVIISDNPGTISSEYPAVFVSLRNSPDIRDIEAVREAIGEFESALISVLSDSKVSENLVTKALDKTAFLTPTNANSDFYNSMRQLRAILEILAEYGIVSPDEYKKIIDFLKYADHYPVDSNQFVINDLGKVLSEGIISGRIKAVPQKGSPYFDPEKSMVVVDDKYINLTTSIIEFKVLPFMKTTSKRNKLLSAAKAYGKLYANNNFKRTIDIEVDAGVTNSFAVYSFDKSMITKECRDKLDMLAYDSYLFDKRDIPAGLIPIITVGGSDKIAGCVIDESTDEGESLYVSGKSRSGKTRFLVEQAVIGYNSGKKVVVFDQTGSFSPEELEKHGVDQSLFSHWDIGKYGIPVDLLSLENCLTLPEKKNRLFSILSLAASITGEVQGKVLKKKLPAIAKAIDSGTIHSLPETLKFFDDDVPEEAIIKERLEEVFCELEGLNTYEQNWGEFIDSQNGIIVISTSSDGIRKSSPLVDMLLASLYEYKQHDRVPRYTVVLDEIEDLCLDKDGPISTILRKGGKHHLSMMLASQEYSIAKDKLGKLIGNCAIHVFFRPKDANIKEIARHIGVDASTLANLQQGECIVYGLLYNKKAEKNKQTTIVGATYIRQVPRATAGDELRLKINRFKFIKK